MKAPQDMLARVEVKVSSRNLDRKDVQTIEQLLRTDVNVDGLLVHNDGITFDIWGKENVDYGILDRLKEELKKDGYPDFKITAIEYKKTGKVSTYDAAGKSG